MPGKVSGKPFGQYAIGEQLVLRVASQQWCGSRVDPAGRMTEVRGTSFAAPLVSRQIADRLHAPDPAAAQRAIRALSAGAQRPKSDAGGLIGFQQRIGAARGHFAAHLALRRDGKQPLGRQPS